ncbi:PilZ domain-containing protein [Denitratisoma oestradiolicum]|uniref:Cyclic diguanosine monophosphate-binding protein n=1 Tax=Denitratisoma oestradiolicum TaxID=311182 RepID=A0A6S6XUF1_9PROT|nr:PilZ domain-containing protein [Denitratisoma oestradiolicum]TWO81077.1 hypothetical protein CBW56_05575 [Denitratisoma oestradiolicum]CAB1367753.1 conserved protein of unknown function [Denitratisoma oestradiolicum]
MTAADRRHFWRATFKSPAHLIDAQGPAQVLVADLSLKGALVEAGADWHGKSGDHCRLRIPLAEGIEINMWVTVAHVSGRSIGLRCEDIDLDSITHLRRLVELNAGDAGLLERELGALVCKD